MPIATAAVSRRPRSNKTRRPSHVGGATIVKSSFGRSRLPRTSCYPLTAAASWRGLAYFNKRLHSAATIGG